MAFHLYMTFFGKYLSFNDAELKEIQYTWTKDRIPMAPPYAPSDPHILGTDREGRDILSLIVMGAKQTLFLVVLITAIRYLFALPLAYFAHKRTIGANHLLNWLNGFFSYIPTTIVVILLATLPPILFNEHRPVYLVFIIAMVELGRVAQMFKVEMDEIAAKEFITGGISIGVSPFRLLKSYFYLQKLLVNLVTDAAKVMFLLGQLAFIGIFISQFLNNNENNWELVNNSNAWPALLINAFNDIRSAVWIPFYPALAMTYAIITFNVFAQGLQNLFKRKADYF
jgi:peptide/nickel transport system permease protein